MRELTHKQKKLLCELRAKREIHKVEDLTSIEWDRLEKMNDTEILYQEVNRFLDELDNRQYGKY